MKQGAALPHLPCMRTGFQRWAMQILRASARCHHIRHNVINPGALIRYRGVKHGNDPHYKSEYRIHGNHSHNDSVHLVGGREKLTPSSEGLGIDSAWPPGFRTQLHVTTSLSTGGGPVSFVQLSEGGFQVVYPLSLWPRSSGVVKVLYGYG